MNVDEYVLEDIVTAHPMRPQILVPFAVLRLADVAYPTRQEATLQVTLQAIRGYVGTRPLKVSWALAHTEAQAATRGMPAESITEFAACGVACVLVARYTGLQIVDTAGRGQGYDYIAVGSEGQEWGLEVSGVTQANLTAQHRLKRNQLLSNPQGLGGYVAVVRFASLEAIFSFHPQGRSRHDG
jgi:hypothetical protein